MVHGNASERYVICPAFVMFQTSGDHRCGDALEELYFVPLVQHMVRSISMQELLGHKAIYQPGVARKVCVFLCECVCVCACACMYAIVCVFQYVCTSRLSVCVSVRVSVSECVCMCVCVCACLYAIVCECVCVIECVHVGMHVCTCRMSVCSSGIADIPYMFHVSTNTYFCGKAHHHTWLHAAE